MIKRKQLPEGAHKCAFGVFRGSSLDYISHYHSPLGDITLTSDGNALVGLWFDGQRYSAATLDPKHTERDDLPLFDQTRRWLDCYFAGKEPKFTPKLTLRATAFRKHVWEALLAIPYGQTASYGEIARRVGVRSAQAVGGAVGRNPIALIIPCHRVVGADGTLVGYAAGLDRKARLLQLENR